MKLKLSRHAISLEGIYGDIMKNNDDVLTMDPYDKLTDDYRKGPTPNKYEPHQGSAEMKRRLKKLQKK